MRSQLDKTLDELYAGHTENLLKWGKPVDKVIVDRKTLTAYPLSEDDIICAEANVTHDGKNCQLCKEIER